MSKSEKFLIWTATLLSDFLLLGVTLFLQIIGYGTSPRNFAESKEELNQLISEAVSNYNQTYYVEMVFIGAFLFGLNYILLKKLNINRPILITTLLLIGYLAISLTSVFILANRYRVNHFIE